jgi:molecular chaperone DnaJ
MPSDAKGGQPGDLYVVIRSVPDARFTRDGADLWRRETLAIPEAVLGVRRTVPTLDGRVDVTIPAGTQPGSVLRLAGKGLPEFGGGRHGHLYLRIEVRVPKRLTKKQRELYAALRALEAESRSESAEDERQRAAP